MSTDLYQKETTRIQYLLPSSMHPSHTTTNIPFSLAYRTLRICNLPADFKRNLETLRQHLLSRHYHPKVIQRAFDKVEAIPREKALEKVKAKETNRIPLVITYHPNLPPVAATVRSHWEVMVERCPRLGRVFDQPSLVAYKRGKKPV